MERARAYFNKAKVDLKSAKILYKKKIFDNSIFFLQQSVEKAIKGYYILYSGASKRKLKEIRHKDPLLFLELFRNFSTKYLKAIKFLKPDWTPSFIDTLDKLMTYKAKFARMNKERIIKLVKILHQITKPTSDIGKGILSIYTRPDVIQSIKPAVNEERLLDDIYARYSLLVLAYLTFPHAISTRYCDELIDPTEYMKGLGIVDAAPDLFKELEKSIKIVERELTAAN
jgi:HEPN domain-containing protein